MRRSTVGTPCGLLYSINGSRRTSGRAASPSGGASGTLPVALAASVGFMLPVATPPNAIVFANPLVTRPAMLRAGAPLDLIGVAVALAAGMVLGPVVF